MPGAVTRRGRVRPVIWLMALVALVGAVAGCVRPGSLSDADATPGTPTVTPLPGGSRAAAPATPSAAASAGPSGPAAGSPSPSPPRRSNRPSVRYVFPVVGKVFYARTHHDYPATDVIASCGSTVRAMVDGVILEVSRVDRWDPKVNAGETRGGLSLSILGDDGVRYYGSHFSAIGGGITPGVRVRAGQSIAKIGETGDASACHLHFGISPPCARTGDWWIRRGVIWPWSYLDAWRAGRSKSPVAEITSWHTAHGCPTVAGQGGTGAG